MKKIIIGLFALTMVSTSVSAAGGKKGKKAKSKVVCGKGCVETKDCKKSTICPTRPGCVCL